MREFFKSYHCLVFTYMTCKYLVCTIVDIVSILPKVELMVDGFTEFFWLSFCKLRDRPESACVIWRYAPVKFSPCKLS